MSIDRLGSPGLIRSSVIRWGAPILSFGDPSSASVATLGLNPSNREFVDAFGNELQGEKRRFHTLRSLGLGSWSDIDARHLRAIMDSYRTYFYRSSYDRWFRRLNQVLSGIGVSYYGTSAKACHLDLIPYATIRKWTELTSHERSSLLSISYDVLGRLIQESSIRVLILNGQGVVRQFEELAAIKLDRRPVYTWSLRRDSRATVLGFAYSGVVRAVSGIPLSNDILVLGFNHNIQSSFGVTKHVMREIRDWLSSIASEKPR